MAQNDTILSFLVMWRVGYQALLGVPCRHGGELGAPGRQRASASVCISWNRKDSSLRCPLHATAFVWAPWWPFSLPLSFPPVSPRSVDEPGLLNMRLLSKSVSVTLVGLCGPRPDLGLRHGCRRGRAQQERALRQV